jgi:hypothetical protein
MQNFQNKIFLNKSKLISTLCKIKREGKTIAAYGAPAKATTFLHYFGIGASVIDFVVDDSPLKIGRYMPGNHIPIVSSEELYKNKPDYVLILAWNFAKPIMEKLKENGYKGKCIVPFP